MARDPLSIKQALVLIESTYLLTRQSREPQRLADWPDRPARLTGQRTNTERQEEAR
ncbi:MAG: hypothetical protein IMW90_16555 [Thermogemmatispora sp.]|uniref:Uncharacterized protein n=1 Tax=Thermogemmatispora aurantia TaxID=2045279 RepID=A0A5J4K6X7_9CHLR|nr:MULTISPECIES: hypothetical protein [Thermogemmatispora]MBE3567329.1 hypothetical protein [Thermogemmatispora sp.]GER82822.1 hypothetical protein KTAU_14590 [Thermogemmatispora aurantia]